MKKIFTSLLLFLTVIVGVNAQQSELIISEYIEGWSNNKALEIYNPTDDAVELIEFRLIRYSNGDDVPQPEDVWTVNLPDYSLEAHQTFVVVLDQRDPDGTGQTAPVWSQLQQRADAFLCPEYTESEAMYFNGDDAIVIEKKTGATYEIQDIFGRWGGPAPAEATFVGSDKKDNAWTDVFPYVNGEGVAITAEHTMIRKSNISTGVQDNPNLFNPFAEYDTLSANTFDHLGWHIFDNAPANETPVITNESLIFAISPTATNGTEIATIQVSDTENDELKFYIDYGNFIYIEDTRIEPFKLDKTTGVLSLVDETGLSPEVKDTFYIDINVTDGYSQLGPVSAMVIVTDNEVSVGSFESGRLEVFPNPVNDNFFQIRDVKAIKEISLSNLLGQQLLKENYLNPVYQKSITLNETPKGIYILNVKYLDGTMATKKLMLK